MNLRPTHFHVTALSILIAVTCTGALAQGAGAPGRLPQRAVSTSGTMAFETLERRAQAEVSYIKKIEVQDLLLKVDGYDEDGTKLKVTLDRRTGEVLAREFKYDKHGPYGRAPYDGSREAAHPLPGRR